MGHYNFERYPHELFRKILSPPSTLLSLTSSTVMCNRYPDASSRQQWMIEAILFLHCLMVRTKHKQLLCLKFAHCEWAVLVAWPWTISCSQAHTATGSLHPPTVTGERMGRVKWENLEAKIRTIYSQKQKTHKSKAEQAIHSPLSMGREVLSLPRKSGLHHA